jgi:hypothetical protein
MGCRASEKPAHARQEFVRIERLDDVIVAADEEPRCPVDGLGPLA